MQKFNRGIVTVSADVSVPADAFWHLLRDWPAVMKWDPGNDPAVPLLRVILKEGHHVDVLPCTRVMHFDTSTGLPPTFEETLLFADPEARRIYYTFSGIPGGLTNYFATTFVDVLDADHARVTCASMFDVPANQSLSDVVAWLEGVYERQIIRGIEAAIKR